MPPGIYKRMSPNARTVRHKDSIVLVARPRPSKHLCDYARPLRCKSPASVASRRMPRQDMTRLRFTVTAASLQLRSGADLQASSLARMRRPATQHRHFFIRAQKSQLHQQRETPPPAPGLSSRLHGVLPRSSSHPILPSATHLRPEADAPDWTWPRNASHTRGSVLFH